MSGGVLEATTSTALARSTVHAQYNRKALGVVLLNNLVPIVLNIKRPGGGHRRAVLVFGRNAHAKSPYQDLGIRKKCCRRVLKFNVKHYVKCYLPNVLGRNGEIHTPYSYNCCNYCGVQLKDACGHLVSITSTRSYNVDKYIYKAPTVLQSCGTAEIFSFRKGNV